MVKVKNSVYIYFNFSGWRTKPRACARKTSTLPLSYIPNSNSSYSNEGLSVVCSFRVNCMGDKEMWKEPPCSSIAVPKFSILRQLQVNTCHGFVGQELEQGSAWDSAPQSIKLGSPCHLPGCWFGELKIALLT